MRDLVERAYFLLCLAMGRLLRSGRYSKTLIVCREGTREVRKHRVFFAPLLVLMGGALFRILNTGVRVLPRRDWEDRERLAYRRLRRTSIRSGADGMLVLPFLPGKTLASLLENPEVAEAVRTSAIELAVVALAELHAQGFTHGDAMAENVMVDLEAGVAHWFDFENAHDTNRSIVWRRADDVRALLATSLLRAAPDALARTLHLILDVYADKEVAGLLIDNFTSAFRRSLTFHLSQAPLFFHQSREIARLLSARVAETPSHDYSASRTATR